MVPWKVTPEDPSDTLVAYERSAWHGGRRYAVFLDGSVQSFSEDAFQKLLEEQEAAHRPAGKDAPASRRQY